MNKILKKSLLLILATLVVIGAYPGLFVQEDGKTHAIVSTQFLTFGFVTPAVAGVVHEDNTITVNVPYGTSRNGLVAYFTHSDSPYEFDAYVEDEEGNRQISEESGNDFTEPRTYRLHYDSTFIEGRDGEEDEYVEHYIEYTVTVTVEPEPTPTPTVTTVAATNIESNSAKVRGSLENNEGSEITNMGFVYSTEAAAELLVAEDGTTKPFVPDGDYNDVEFYSIDLTDLEPGVTYYYVAFVTNQNGTYYGEKLNFTTSTLKPTITEIDDQEIYKNESTGPLEFTIGDPQYEGGEYSYASVVTSAVHDNNELVGEGGITISGTDTKDRTITVTPLLDQTGVVTITITVTNQSNDTVTTDFKVTVLDTVLIATTNSVADITGTSAVVHASVTDESDVGIGERGIVYSSTNEVPTVEDAIHTDAANTEGDYSTSLSDLARNTTYYVRAYASNGAGPVYGAVQSFTTLPQLTAFSFTAPAATGTINEVAKTVAITVPFGTDVTALTATFTIIGHNVFIGEGEGAVLQESSFTTNNFTSPVVYEVYAVDNTTYVAYTVTVTVAARISNESPTAATPLPAPTKQIIIVDVKNSGAVNGGVVSTAEIERTTQPDGTKKDDVQFNVDQAKKTIDSIITAGSKSASIVIPDTKDEVSEVDVTVPKESSKLIADSKIDLGISTDNVKVIIPNSSLEGFNDDLFFKFIPIKKEAEKQEVKTRASNEAIVKIVAGDNEVSIVGRPMTIETNMQSRLVTLVMPLGDVNLSEDELKNLGIFIEHSDGTKELLRGILVPFNDEGDLGLQFTVTKFSTFTLVHIDGLAVQEHTAYMKGYTDGTFRAERSITRAEMAAILSRVVNLGNTIEDRVYTDVSPTLWAKSAISKVTTMGLMKGYSDGTFGANKAVSRAEMSVLISLLMTNPSISGAGFTDIAGHWAEPSILSAQAAGMMNGYADNTFKPDDSLTRAETVTIMNKVLGRRLLKGMDKLPWSDVPSSHWAIVDIAEASVDHRYEAVVDGEQWVITP